MLHNKTVTIWVETLGIFDFIRLFIETSFSGASVRYDEKNSPIITDRLIGKLQNYGLCKRFRAAKLTLDKKDAAGCALRYRRENDLNACLDEFCRKYIPAETERFKGAVKSYISFYLSCKITFITMIESSDEFNRGGANVIYITRHPLNSVIKQYYEGKGYTVRGSILLAAYIQYFLKPFRMFSVFMVRMLFPPKGRLTITEPKPSVWIEYYHNDRLGLPFHLDAIDIKKFDIVFYLDRHDGVPLADEIKAIERMRLKWIDLRSDSFTRLANIGARQFWDMASALFYSSSGLPFWFRVFRFEFRMLYLLYKAIFIRFKVKILIEHQEMSWVKEPQVMALEDAGGIMIGYHFSNWIFYKQADFFLPQHVYFVWGKIAYEYLQKKGNISRHVLPSGIWFGSLGKENSAIGLRNDLKFIMAIFDSSVGYNMHQSEETLSMFYLKILGLLEENPEWGGIVKSKLWGRINDLEFLPHGKEIASRAVLLKDQKRFVFLNSNVSPVTAASHADLSVCYNLNSAGIISGIYGHKAVHWDSSGWLHYPMYKNLSGKIVFQDLEEMAQALIRASAGDVEIGDFSKWREIFNYFGDFNGRHRMGDFIRSFMEDISVSNDPAKSLDRTVTAYVKKNDIKNSFFEKGNLWEDA